MVEDRKKEEELISEVKKRWDELIDKGQVISLQKGQYLFYENHNPVGAYLLCKGTILLSKRPSQDFHKVISAKSQPVIGMDYLLTGEAYHYSALAESDAELCYLPKSEILKLLRIN